MSPVYCLSHSIATLVLRIMLQQIDKSIEYMHALHKENYTQCDIYNLKVFKNMYKEYFLK